MNRLAFVVILVLAVVQCSLAINALKRVKSHQTQALGIEAATPYDAARHRAKHRPVVGGVSAGMNAKQDLGGGKNFLYWTIGAIICDEAGEKYGLTNLHNFPEGELPVAKANLGELPEITNMMGLLAGDAKKVVQPSRSGVDGGTGADVVGEYADFFFDRDVDSAVFKLSVAAEPKVLGKSGANEQLFDEKAPATKEEMLVICRDKPQLYASTRFGWVDCAWSGSQIGAPDCMAYDTDGAPGDVVRPFLTCGNDQPGMSGSVVWLPKDGGMQPVALLFQQFTPMSPIYYVLDKLGTKMGKTLSMCVPPAPVQVAPPTTPPEDIDVSKLKDPEMVEAANELDEDHNGKVTVTEAKKKPNIFSKFIKSCAKALKKIFH